MSRPDDVQPDNRPLVLLDESGRIIADVSCLRCAYDLRILPMNGRRPECGLPLERSARGNPLRSCNPAWLERMSRGASWLAVGNGMETIATLFVRMEGLFLVLRYRKTFMAAARQEQ